MVAVDCNGADLGPARSPPGRRSPRSRACACSCSGPPAELGSGRPPGVEVVDAPVSIAKSPDPVSAARTTPEASIVQAAQAVAAGPRAGARVRGRHRRGAGGRHCSTSSARAASTARRSRSRCRSRAPAGDAARRRRQRRGAPRAPRAVRVHGRRARRSTVLGVERPRVGLLSNGEEAARGSALVLEAHAELARAREAGRRGVRVRRQRRGRTTSSAAWPT